MIKCNVTVCGTISHAAEMRTRKDGKNYLAMSVNVVLPAKSGINKTIEIRISKDGDFQEECNSYPVGSRIEATGTLTIRKKDEELTFYLSVSDIHSVNTQAEDSIKGDMEFRGTVGKRIDSKKDKKGNPYYVFTAFSSERNGVDATGKPSYSFIWIRFIHFGESSKEWMSPKIGIEVKGEMQMEVYNDLLDINCRVHEISPWDKQTRNN